MSVTPIPAVSHLRERASVVPVEGGVNPDRRLVDPDLNERALVLAESNLVENQQLLGTGHGRGSPLDSVVRDAPPDLQYRQVGIRISVYSTNIARGYSLKRQQT